MTRKKSSKPADADPGLRSGQRLKVRKTKETFSECNRFMNSRTVLGESAINANDDEPEGVAKLRWRAEEVAQKQGASSPGSRETLSPEEALRLIQELRVHQIELKMQNDELRRAHDELDAIRARYFDLFNLAPVGYFIVSHDGRFLEANLTGVNLLGVFRAALIKKPITRFILKEDQDVYYLHRTQLLATGEARTCELRMVKADGTTFWARLTTTTTQAPSTSSGDGNGSAPMIRVVLSDISEQKQMEQDKAALDAQLQLATKRPLDGAKPGRGKGGKGTAEE
jgi:PAS domain S-box-containing protein